MLQLSYVKKTKGKTVVNIFLSGYEIAFAVNFSTAFIKLTACILISDIKLFTWFLKKSDCCWKVFLMVPWGCAKIILIAPLWRFPPVYLFLNVIPLFFFSVSFPKGSYCGGNNQVTFQLSLVLPLGEEVWQQREVMLLVQGCLHSQWWVGDFGFVDSHWWWALLLIWMPHGVCCDKHKHWGAMTLLVLNNSVKQERKSFCCSWDFIFATSGMLKSDLCINQLSFFFHTE